MQAHYTRLFSDENGASRFEDLTIELQRVFSAPGLETSIFSAPFLASLTSPIRPVVPRFSLSK